MKDEILEKIEREVGSVVTIHSEEGVNAPKIVEEFSTIVPLDEQSKLQMGKQISAAGILSR